MNQSPGPCTVDARSAEVRGLTRVWKPRATDANHGIPRGFGLVDRVLRIRGVHAPDAQERFLRPSLMHLHDPQTLPGVDRAAERLLAAVRRGETVAIYGDYDVDGITATAILYHTLKAIEPDARVLTYVPHRLDEGYGINAEALASLARRGATVVVSVDCGITALEPARAAGALGIDLIITDHHNIGGPPDAPTLPDAYALVHPRLPGSAYPFGDLCGAGVAYKLAWRLATMHRGASRVDDRLRALLIELLALVALGVIADVVPLRDENRVLARFGLPRIQHSKIPGLRALVRAAGLDGDKIDAERVGFSLAPRLNACGRMGHAGEAVELLTTATGARADGIAAMLTSRNDARRATERRIVDQASRLAEERGMTTDDRRAIVLADPEWHPGVVGIVCSRLVERYARPALLLQRQETGGEVVCCGSGRSIDGFNLHAALAECADHLLGFGGHDMAAGLRVAGDRLDAFTDAFLGVAGARLGPEDLVRPARYDDTVALDELTAPAVRDLDALAPFGRDNESVCLRLSGVRVSGAVRTFGKRGEHLRLRLEGGASGVDAVAWRWAEHADAVPAGATVEALVRPKISSWTGRVEPELVDLRIAAG